MSGRWSKDEIIEGVVAGGERIHGYAPDGRLLCGATGEDGSEAHDRWEPHGDPRSFDPDHADACRRCAASWRTLPD